LLPFTVTVTFASVGSSPVLLVMSTIIGTISPTLTIVGSIVKLIVGSSRTVISIVFGSSGFVLFPVALLVMYTSLSRYVTLTLTSPDSAISSVIFALPSTTVPSPSLSPVSALIITAVPCVTGLLSLSTTVTSTVTSFTSTFVTTAVVVVGILPTLNTTELFVALVSSDPSYTTVAFISPVFSGVYV